VYVVEGRALGRRGIRAGGSQRRAGPQLSAEV